MMKQIVDSVKNVALSVGSPVKCPVEDHEHIKNICSVTADKQYRKASLLI